MDLPHDARVIDGVCPWVRTDADGSNLRVDQFVTARVGRVSKALSRSTARLYLAEFDVTVPEWRVLANVALRGSCSARELIEDVAMDKSLVSRSIQQLVGKGLLTARPNEVDRRTSLLRLTAKGVRTYQELLPKAQRRQATLLEDLGEQERRVLWAALEKLEAKARALAEMEESAMR
jgi:DNA-binding MarR family transcriptional regulator